MSRFRLGVLASGSGTNLQALLDAARAPEFPAEVAVVVSNVATAGALDRAHAVGIPAAVIDSRASRSREELDRSVLDVLASHRVDAVCLAGYMRLVTPSFLAAFPERILNIHPALLPCFPGLHAVRQALHAGVRVTGCTVHFVDEGTDTGPIVVQAAVPVRVGDDEQALAARIRVQEHRIYPLAVRWLAEGRLRIEGRRVLVKGARPGDGALLSPEGDGA